MPKKQHQIRIDPKLPLQGKRIGIAVSGGADSVALLQLLLELKPRIGFVPCVIHVNHMLRGRASDADEKFVAKLAKSNKLEFFTKEIDIAAIAKKQKANVEEVARRERYAFFEELVRQGRVDKVAVAHTADDQAETVLGHILRGTGLAGLGGIHPETGSVFRPLLAHRRADLRRYLRSIGQRWHEDATNQDTGRTRARIRHKLIPLLEKEFSPAAVLHLCQLAEMARSDEAYLDQESAIQAERWVIKEGTAVRLRIAELFGLGPALQSRVLRRIIKDVKSRTGQISVTHINSLLDLAGNPESGKSLQLPGGVEVRREREVLRFRAAGTSGEMGNEIRAKEFAYPVDLRGGKAELRVVETSCLLHFREIDWPAEGRETTKTGTVLDRSKLALPLVVRNWKPGDAMRPQGHQKAHKLGRLLNEKSICRWDKETWPVLTSGGKLAWVRGLRESVEFAVGPETRRALLITEESIL